MLLFYKVMIFKPPCLVYLCSYRSNSTFAYTLNAYFEHWPHYSNDFKLKDFPKAQTASLIGLADQLSVNT